jgi:transcriptional regulator with XRE-family HTH domain
MITFVTYILFYNCKTTIMELVDRFKYLMKLNNLSASAFAEKVGVQPSSISHILSGRNKPSLEFTQKVLAQFPKVSADWLISGKTTVIENNMTEPERKEKSTLGNVSQSSPTLSGEKKIKKIVLFYSDNSFEEFNQD